MKKINLLSKESQKTVRFLAFFRLALNVFIVTGVFWASAVVLAFGSWFFATGVQKQAEKDLAMLQVQESKSDYAKLRENIQVINNTIVDANTVFAKMPKISKALAAVFAEIPEGVSLQSVNLETTKRQLNITGFSLTRGGILELHKNIVMDKAHFDKIDYPLENLSRPKNVPFHFSITLNSSLLQ
jgi:Tfp pilus assembly protein PilN